MNKKIKQAGFTLLEVMIAIVVLSFIVIAIVQITGGAQDKVDITLLEDKEMLQIETAFSRFEWDFSQIYSPLYHSHELKVDELASDDSKAATQRVLEPYQSKPRFDKLSYDGIPVPKFSFSDKNEIVFFTNSNRRKLKNIKQSHFAWVKYELITNRDVDIEEAYPNGVKKTRVRGVWVRKVYTKNIFENENIDWSKVKAQVLLRNVESVKMEFWDSNKKKWLDNIRSIENGEYIFRGVRITLKWMGAYEDEQIHVRVFKPLFPQFLPEDMYELLNASENDNLEENDDGGDDV